MPELILSEPVRLKNEPVRIVCADHHKSSFILAEERKLIFIQKLNQFASDSKFIKRISQKSFDTVIRQEGKLDCLFCAFVNALELARKSTYKTNMDSLQSKRSMIDDAIRFNQGLRLYDYGFSELMLRKYAPDLTLVRVRSNEHILKCLFLYDAIGIIGLQREYREGHAIGICLNKGQNGKVKLALFGDPTRLQSVVELDFIDDLDVLKLLFQHTSRFFFFLPKDVVL